MLNGLSHLKWCQVYLVSEKVEDGEQLDEVVKEAAKLNVGVVLMVGDHASIALDAPRMPVPIRSEG